MNRVVGRDEQCRCEPMGKLLFIVIWIGILHDKVTDFVRKCEANSVGRFILVYYRNWVLATPTRQTIKLFISFPGYNNYSAVLCRLHQIIKRSIADIPVVSHLIGNPFRVFQSIDSYFSRQAPWEGGIQCRFQLYLQFGDVQRISLNGFLSFLAKTATPAKRGPVNCCFWLVKQVRNPHTQNLGAIEHEVNGWVAFARLITRDCSWRYGQTTLSHGFRKFFL